MRRYSIDNIIPLLFGCCCIPKEKKKLPLLSTPCAHSDLAPSHSWHHTPSISFSHAPKYFRHENRTSSVTLWLWLAVPGFNESWPALPLYAWLLPHIKQNTQSSRLTSSPGSRNSIIVGYRCGDSFLSPQLTTSWMVVIAWIVFGREKWRFNGRGSETI